MVWLRILQINDVYELDNFASLKTAIEHYRQGRDVVDDKTSQPDLVLVVCCGDFLAPSLLSSLDGGVAMMDCLMQLGVTHLCLGNHEADVPMSALAQRILQSRSNNKTSSDSNNNSAHQKQHPDMVWLNTNMTQLDEKLSAVHRRRLPAGQTWTKTHDIITVSSSSSSSNDDMKNIPPRRVALLGLITPDPALYRAGAFGDAVMEPVIPTTQHWLKELCGSSTNKVDLILPLTHQSIDDDRTLAKHCTGDTLPIVLGGHEHEIYHETVSGCTILKTGIDAQHLGILDLIWPDNNGNDNSNPKNSKPQMEIHVCATRDFAPDPVMAASVQRHGRILFEIEHCPLFPIADWLPQQSQQSNNNHDDPPLFSTKNNRLGPSTGTTAFCTMLRMGLRCDCAMINAGCVRGNTDYASDANFTYSDLKTEMPFSTQMTVQYIPGHVIQDTIVHSRRLARQDPPQAFGGYLHTCSAITYDPHHDADQIVEIAGQPFDPDRNYFMAFPVQFLMGIDNHEPLLKWAKGNKKLSSLEETPQSSNVDTTQEEEGEEQQQQQHEGDEYEEFEDDERAQPAKMILVQFFSSMVWLRLGSFDQVDLNNDGVLTRDEVKHRLLQLYNTPSCNVDDDNDDEDCLAELVADNIFGVADLDSDGMITPLEMMMIQFAARDMMHHVVTSEERDVLKQIVAQVMGIHSPNTTKGDDDDVAADNDDAATNDDVPWDDMVDQLLQAMDTSNRNGKLERSELMQILGRVAKPDLYE